MTKVYQIYFDESQKHMLEAEYIPYFNPLCSVFFENTVIKDLIETKQHEGSDYFGVVSYKLRQKLQYTKAWRAHPNIANKSTTEFTPTLFESELRKHLPDVLSFQCHMPHDPIELAGRFHPKFVQYFSEIMHTIGYDWKPTVFANVFYCQYFVAKTDWYERFVTEMLIPAMHVMENMPELMQNSQYEHRLPEYLHKKWGISYYPYHSFLCERMFSYFAHLHGLVCKHY